MSFFKRSGIYNLYYFGTAGYKKKKKKRCENSKKIWEHMFVMQASDCVNNYLTKNKFFVALSTICDTVLHISKYKCYYHLFGRNKFFRL